MYRPLFDTLLLGGGLYTGFLVGAATMKIRLGRYLLKLQCRPLRRDLDTTISRELSDVKDYLERNGESFE